MVMILSREILRLLRGENSMTVSYAYLIAKIAG
jgi:hypothetical protein